MMAKSKHTPEEYAELRKRGLNNVQIASALGVSEASVRRGLKKVVDSGEYRILIVDIETRPSLAYIWRVWQENISNDQLIQPTEMISWAAKWVGVDGVKFASVYHDGKKKMVQGIWHLLNEADAVLHFNGRKFDVPHLQREFLEGGLLPPAPYKQIDLIDAVRKQFRFTSNRLAHVSKVLGLEGKVEHEGFPLWVKCMNGEDDAWTRMREYNIQDVLLLEDLYGIMLPWLPNHPSIAAFKGEDCCTKCGSDDLKKRGFAYTNMGKFQQYCCGACGSWVRGNKRLGGTKVASVKNS
jgi:hypothetical protein